YISSCTSYWGSPYQHNRHCSSPLNHDGFSSLNRFYLLKYIVLYQSFIITPSANNLTISCFSRELASTFKSMLRTSKYPVLPTNLPTSTIGVVNMSSTCRGSYLLISMMGDVIPFSPPTTTLELSMMVLPLVTP